MGAIRSRGFPGAFPACPGRLGGLAFEPVSSCVLQYTANSAVRSDKHEVPMAKTGLVYCEEALLHDTGDYHPESPARLTAILDALDAADLDPPRLDVSPATDEDLLRVHDAQHVAVVKACCETDNLPYPDPDTVMGEGSWPAALLSAGGAIAACKAVMDGDFDNVFSVMRPPGHHAERDHAMGFCLFNNICVAAQWLRQVAGLHRVAILDWDIHHGNGTQHITYEDETIYYASLHQHPHYPGTGFPHERGKHNTNLNIQMPPGCAPEEWLAALKKMVLPELQRFAPDFLLISAGFDAHRLDPLGRQLLEAEHFAEITRILKPLAKGRVVSLLEGGYHLKALGDSAVAHVKALQED